MSTPSPLIRRLPSDLANIAAGASGASRALLERMAVHFDRYGWPRTGARILIGLSGGPDSVALLAALLLLGENHQWVVAAAHVNYALRGADADADEAFCRELSRRWAIDLHVYRCSPEDRNIAGNLQQWARDIRYRFFERLATDSGYDYIAIAHTLDDRAETVAAAVLQAAGTFALSGIPPVRGKVIRPFFSCDAATVRHFLNRYGIASRRDITNDRNDFFRNRIRHEIIPQWRTGNPAIVEGLARMGEHLYQQHRFLFREAERCLSEALLDAPPGRILLDTQRLERYDLCLDPFVLRSLIRRVGLSMVPTPATVGRFGALRRGSVSGQVEQGELVIVRSKGRLLVTRRSISGNPVSQKEVRIEPGMPGVLGSWRVEARVEPVPDDPRSDNRCLAFVDIDKVESPLTLRLPCDGDRYAPLGLGGRKKLKDILADQGVPVFSREAAPVLTDTGGILWPIGCPIAERVRITAETRGSLRISATQV